MLSGRQAVVPDTGMTVDMQLLIVIASVWASPSSSRKISHRTNAFSTKTRGVSKATPACLRYSSAWAWHCPTKTSSCWAF